MIVSTVDKKQSMINQIVDSFNVTTIVDKETCDLIFHTKLLRELNIGENYTVSAMATKDPTPCSAFGAVSLGYKRQRWMLKNARLISLTPPTFRGWKAYYDMDVLLEMWD